MRLLITEDSAKLRETLALMLRESGYVVDEAGDGEEALWKAENTAYDLVILDLMLPRLDGMEVIRRLRRQKDSSLILILSAKDAVEDRILGLREGADDYLTKPFVFDELLARIQALCRRAYESKNPILRAGELSIDTRSKVATCNEQPIELTPREYGILEFLILRRGNVVTRTEIESHVYDEMGNPMSNVIDKAVCLLRAKIADGGGPSDVILTRRGHGYIIENDNES